MTELKTITGNALYSQEYKEDLMREYGKFYSGLKEYKRDEYLDMIWLPDPKDIFKYDRKNPMHVLDFTRRVQACEIEKDEAELEHFRSLHKYDKKLTDKQLRYWEVYYHIRDLERKQVFDKSRALKDALVEQKNMLEMYKDEAPVEGRDTTDPAVCECSRGACAHQGPQARDADYPEQTPSDTAGREEHQAYARYDLRDQSP